MALTQYMTFSIIDYDYGMAIKYLSDELQRVNSLHFILFMKNQFLLLSLLPLHSDMSKNPNLTKNSPVTPASSEPPAAPGPRQHHRKNQQKKKKNNRF